MLLKNKKPKPEDFIGETFNEGRLRVVGIAERLHSNTKYYVTCTECSKDKELFPDEYFISTRGSLKNGHFPCGCSEGRRWLPFQYIVLANRSSNGSYIVHGFAEEFHGNETKVECECCIDGHRWQVKLYHLISSKSGCPECAVRRRTDILRKDYETVISQIKVACDLKGYKFICFVSGYRNKDSKLYYECPNHGVRLIRCSDLLRGSSCSMCAKYGYKENQSGWFYVYEWSHGSNDFIKFGVTNRNLKSRIREQAKHTNFTNTLIYCRKFENGRIPKMIEDEVKASGVELNVISKLQFPDGFTETTWISNLNKILKIVEKYSKEISV